MAQDFEQGDRVKWNTPQGETYGKVKKKLTSSTEVGGQKIRLRGQPALPHREREERQRGRPQAGFPEQGIEEEQMADDRQQTIDEFEDAVNMTRKELEDWLGTEESQSVGQGDGESKGHESGRNIVKILEKNKSDYTDDDVQHMKKVNSYLKRHLGQGPKNNVEDSNWRYSLMNWGHDPLKG